MYEGRLISKRKYTSVRNSSDIVKQSDNGLLRNLKTGIMQGCEILKIIPYKTLMTHVRNIDIGEVLGLEILAEKLSTEAGPGVYRPLKPFLLKLADLYLLLHEKNHAFTGLMAMNQCFMWRWVRQHILSVSSTCFKEFKVAMITASC